MRVRTRHEHSWRVRCASQTKRTNMPKSAKSSLLSTEDTHAVQRAVEAALAVVLQERKKKPTTESPPPVSDVEQQIAKAAAGPTKPPGGRVRYRAGDVKHFIASGQRPRPGRPKKVAPNVSQSDAPAPRRRAARPRADDLAAPQEPSS